MQCVRARAGRLIDEGAGVEHGGTGQIHLRAEADDTAERWSAGEVGAVVDKILVHAVDAVVLPVAGIGDVAVDRDLVVGGHVGDQGGIQRLLVEIHVVVVAAAVVAGEAHAPGQIRDQRTAHIEARDALLVGVRLDGGGGRERGHGRHLGGDIDGAAHTRPGSALDAGRTLDDVDGVHHVEADRRAVAVEREAVAHPVVEHVGVLAADARYVRLAERGVRIGARGQGGESAGILHVEGVELRFGQDGIVARGIHHAEIEPVSRVGGDGGGHDQVAALDAVHDDFIEIVG